MLPPARAPVDCARVLHHGGDLWRHEPLRLYDQVRSFAFRLVPHDGPDRHRDSLPRQYLCRVERPSARHFHHRVIVFVGLRFHKSLHDLPSIVRSAPRQLRDARIDWVARVLMVLGLVILTAGLLWPYLSQLGLGRRCAE
jgi:hypothetical protein